MRTSFDGYPGVADPADRLLTVLLHRSVYLDLHQLRIPMLQRDHRCQFDP